MKSVIKISGLVIALVFIVAFISCAGNRTHESTGQYIDDSTITTKVKAALLADPDVSGLDVNVETFKGVVQLSGFVDDQKQANRAVEIARSVNGVKGVENRLTVKGSQ
ncbi:MAG: transporter [Candidatus Dadabacteria bacterium]